MNRRYFLALSVVLPAFGGETSSFRGKLVQPSSGKAALQLPDGRLLVLSGDAETEAVLSDERLRGADFEVAGKLAGTTIQINPIHTASIWVHKGGKRLRVTYWCDICAIRTTTPGLCQCCREETVLDLRESW
jgi:hypothetical protein